MRAFRTITAAIMAAVIVFFSASCDKGKTENGSSPVGTKAEGLPDSLIPAMETYDKTSLYLLLAFSDIESYLELYTDPFESVDSAKLNLELIEGVRNQPAAGEITSEEHAAADLPDASYDAYRSFVASCKEMDLSIDAMYALNSILTSEKGDRESFAMDLIVPAVEYYKNIQTLAYNRLNMYLLNYPTDTAKMFWATKLTEFKSYDRYAAPWNDDPKVIAEKYGSTIETLSDKIYETKNLLSEHQDYIDELKEVKEFAAKISQLEESESEFAETLRKLDEKKQKARAESKPEIGDSFNLLWSKALCFYDTKDMEYLNLCLEVFVQKAETAPGENITLESASKIAAAAAAFWKEARAGKRDGGVMVFSFDPPGSHDFLQPGDIIVKINGSACKSMEEFTSNRRNYLSNDLAYLRLEDGKLTQRQNSFATDYAVKVIGANMIEPT